MKEDEAIIEQYMVDTKKVQQKISELRSGAVTFQVIFSSTLIKVLALNQSHFLFLSKLRKIPYHGETLADLILTENC